MPSQHADLPPHPANPHPALGLGLGADVERTADGLELRYELLGDVAAVRWPEPAAPWRADGLWRHTCFEAFCAVPGGSAYYEFNFSPAGAWAAYRFGGYRERVADPELRGAPLVALRDAAGGAQLEVKLDMRGLPRLAATAPIELALAVVIEGRDHAIHHFALAHPAEQADFHDRRGFLLTLPGTGRRGR
jgi:hypothetical protein